MQGPKITVITVAFNAIKAIERTIKSVLSQHYDNLEYIIIDGASTDGTLEIINSYRTEILKLISEKDHGIYDAMNKGIMLASGDLICLLNADDYFADNAINTVAQIYKQTTMPEAIYYSDAYINYEEVEKVVLRKANLDLTVGMRINHQAMFVCRSVYRKYGLYDLSYRFSADYDFTIRAQQQRVKFVYIEKPLVYSTRNNSRASEKYAKLAVREDYRIYVTHWGFKGKVYFARNYSLAKIRQVFHIAIEYIFGRQVWLWLRKNVLVNIRP